MGPREAETDSSFTHDVKRKSAGNGQMMFIGRREA